MITCHFSPHMVCQHLGSIILLLLTEQNREVIEQVTIPNVVLNLCRNHHESTSSAASCTSSDLTAGLASRASFFSGDWGSMSEVLVSGCEKNAVPEGTRDGCLDEKFDLILTSETIYNPECHLKLLHLLTTCLKEDGLMYPFMCLDQCSSPLP